MHLELGFTKKLIYIATLTPVVNLQRARIVYKKTSKTISTHFFKYIHVRFRSGKDLNFSKITFQNSKRRSG